MTAAELRAKEGSSGTRETVAVSPGIEITLVYGADRRVSRIELPGVGPDGTYENLSISEREERPTTCEAASGYISRHISVFWAGVF
jgi:hypothetical protein